MPKKRQQHPKTKLAYFPADQLIRVLKAAKEHGSREHCMFLLASRMARGHHVNAFLIRQQFGHKSFQSTLQCVSASDKQASEAAARAFPEVF